MSVIRNVLLDLDGTLTDSERGIIGSMRYALQAMGRASPDDAALRRLIGPPTFETFATLLGDDLGAIDECVHLYRVHYGELGLFQGDLYPGVVDMLGALGQLGCRLFLATSKPLVYARRILDHYALTSCFAGVYGAELDGTRADKAELIRHLLITEQLDPAQCLMVGDRKHDILGARANRVVVCCARWGYGEDDEIRAAAPDHECATPIALPLLVRELSTRTADFTRQS